jgi:ankyrin repeat protein
VAWIHNTQFYSLFAESPDKEILWASENGKLSVVERLILVDPMLIHVKDKDGYTPLHRACYNNHELVVDVSTCFIDGGLLGCGAV